jgi:peptidoglycan lytic transglycosylase G
MRRQKRRLIQVALGIVALLAVIWLYGLYGRLAPMPKGPAFYVRFSTKTPLSVALQTLQTRKVVRDSGALGILAAILRHSGEVEVGTYQFEPGMSATTILRATERPIFLKVRIPETNWAKRTGRLLAKREIVDADDYLNLVHHPELFQSEVSFPLPKDNLEGYLYPDTYELPPLIGAKAVIEEQLQDFQKKVWKGLNHPSNLSTLLTKASLIEMEVSRDDERPKVAAVIDNRLNKGMMLQIDASICYGLQQWRPLTRADYKNVQSPYNLYKHNGLPPTPICSPTVKSIEAVLHPANANYLFYVALPSGKTLFSADYADHLKNIHLRKVALKELEKS